MRYSSLVFLACLSLFNCFGVDDGPSVNITGTLHHDTDAKGIQGIHLSLLIGSSNGLFGETSYSSYKTSVTDANGVYVFEDVPIGEAYELEVTDLPAGWAVSGITQEFSISDQATPGASIVFDGVVTKLFPDISAVQMLDANTVFAVGGRGFHEGVSLQTHDGGSHWVVVSDLPTTFSFQCVDFVDSQTGYSEDGAGGLYKTTNGGANWIVLNGGDGYAYGGGCMDFISANVGYAAGTYSVLKTTDGGTTWTRHVVDSTRGITAVHFVNASTGYVIGLDNLIAKTLDGGNTWTFLNPSSIPIMPIDLPAFKYFGLDFVSASTGYVVGLNGLIMKTVDGGAHWTGQSSGTSQTLYAVDFVDALTGYAVGDGTIIKTVDGGTTWISQSPGVPNTLSSVSFLNATLGFAVGSDGTVLKTTNGGASWLYSREGSMAVGDAPKKAVLSN